MRCYSIDDLRKASRKALPKVIFDFIEGGAEDEVTIGKNLCAFQRYEFVPRVLCDVSTIDLSTRVQCIDSSMPLICAPTAMSRLFHYKGEEAVALAAQAAGIPYSLSTVANYSIEQIAGLSRGSKLFQIYVWHNRQLVDEFIERCQRCEYDGLMLAVDFVALGKRERDLHNGHGRPLEMRVKTALGGLARLRWLYRFLSSPPLKMANMQEHLSHNANALKVIDSIHQQFDPAISWEDARRLRDKWQGAFLLKGIQCVDDARRAVDIGASGIVLSNHGGRQLDGAPSAMDILPQVYAAVGNDLEIIVDGGIRRGSDIIKAIALGAKACMIGRPYLYGLSAGGEAGVSRSLEILRTEMELVMKFIGCESIDKLDASYVNLCH
jgi:L-lactate dehydrogenase (cytochrome)